MPFLGMGWYLGSSLIVLLFTVSQTSLGPPSHLVKPLITHCSDKFKDSKMSGAFIWRVKLPEIEEELNQLPAVISDS